MVELKALKAEVKKRGCEKSIRFWSVKKCLEWLGENPPERTIGKLVTDAPPKQSTRKQPSKSKLVRYLVTWKGKSGDLAHAPFQEMSKISFSWGHEVDIYEAILSEMGSNLSDEHVKQAKIWAKRAAKCYKEMASHVGTSWVYRETVLLVPVKKIDRTGPTDGLKKLLEGEIDEVMAYTRKLLNGSIEPITGTVEKDISTLYHIELDSREYRPALIDWLYDDSREAQSLPRLRTNVRMNPEEATEEVL